MRRSDWLGLVLMVVSISAVGARVARASDIQGALVRPTGVTFEPDAANPATALRVRIQGVAAIAEPTGCYTAPTCGYLYYSCKPGEEALCREQWQEIGAAASAGHCVSFGARRVNGAMVNNGNIRALSDAPTTPDAYLASEGLGVATIDCTPALFSCAITLAGACPPPGGPGCCAPPGTGGRGEPGGRGGDAGGVAGGGGGAGAGGVVGTGGVAGGGGVSASAGASGGAGIGGTAGGGSARGTGGATPAPSGYGGAGNTSAVTPGSGSGCALAGGRLGGAGLTALAAATLALAAAVRRRGRGRRRG
ncbi:MAG: hypothetical protein ACJ8F1_06310 [Polyangia bacterium]